ncbi:MAG: long-chain-fatty-acid--CoA ligase [Acidimicrobiia bacterium]
MNENVAWIVRRAVGVSARRTAVIDGDVHYDYATLDDRLRRLAGGMAGLGLGLGDVVAVLAANSYQHLECGLGLPSAGLVINDLNYRLSANELTFIVNDSNAKVIVTDATHLATARTLMDQCRSLTAIVYAGTGEAPSGTVGYDALLAADPVESVESTDDTLAAICYTGGTTGLPKGVMLSHRNLVQNAKHALFAMAYTPDDSYLHATPMFHAADTAETYAATWAGAGHVILPGFDAQLLVETVERDRPTVMTLVPTMINLLVNLPGVEHADLSSVRRMIYGASPMPAELQRKALALLPVEWSQLYGMTEAAPIVTHLSPIDHVRGATGEEPYATRLRAAGTAVPGVEVSIRDAEGNPCPTGEPGEIWCRGTNFMLGYLNRAEETEKALAGGWYHSGDMGYLDADGYVYVVDRVKDMIVSGGENVYSVEVENAIYQHPAVLEAAVIGVPDDTWVERVHAIVVLKPNAVLTADELRDHCRQFIGGYKVPRTIEFRTDALPKSGAGKILKRELRG